MVPKLISIVAAVSLAAVFPGDPGPVDQLRIEDNIIIPSYDAEPIVGTLMLPPGASAADPVPVVLRTHGWGQRRLRAPDALMQRLLDSGYAIFTWDSRGFGHSGGEANWGAPDYEVRDASAIIDHLATRVEIATDAPGDPKIGWIGASNAGGVQLNTAAIDHRVDAIVPQHSWGNLLSDLMPNGVYKKGWGNRLYRRGLVGARSDGLEGDNPAGPQEGDFARQFHDAHESWNATGVLSQELRDWFLARSTTARASLITTPTMIVHGAIDTLFPLQGALKNYRHLVMAGTPAKLLVYCSGHTLQGCPYPGGRSGDPSGESGSSIWEQRIVSWLDRHVKGDVTAATGSQVEWQAPDGYYYSAPEYPLTGTDHVYGVGFRTGSLRGPMGTGGDTGADAGPAPSEELGVSAVRRRVFSARRQARPMFGVPKARLSGRLTGASSGIVHLELVDVSPGGARTTVNHQTTPLRLGRGSFDRRIKLSAIAWVLRRGHSLELEITTRSPMFRPSSSGDYRVTARAIVRVPVAPSHWVSVSARS